MPDRQPWERQPNETDRAWAAFQVYYNMPPSERSHDAAYRERYKKGPNAHATKTFRTWSNHHDWKNRAGAWDRHLDDIERAVTEQERVEWRKDRRSLLRTFLTTVTQAIENFDPTDVRMNQLTSAVEMITQEMRAEMDDLPTEKHQISGGVAILYTGNADPNEL